MLIFSAPSRAALHDLLSWNKKKTTVDLFLFACLDRNKNGAAGGCQRSEEHNTTHLAKGVDPATWGGYKSPVWHHGGLLSRTASSHMKSGESKRINDGFFFLFLRRQKLLKRDIRNVPLEENVKMTSRARSNISVFHRTMSRFQLAFGPINTNTVGRDSSIAQSISWQAEKSLSEFSVINGSGAAAPLPVNKRYFPHVVFTLFVFVFFKESQGYFGQRFCFFSASRWISPGRCERGSWKSPSAVSEVQYNDTSAGWQQQGPAQVF